MASSFRAARRLGFLTAVMLVVYLVLRAWATFHVVSTVSYPGFNDLQNSDDHLRVATFNIAHGRGPKYGARNWDASDSQRQVTVTAIADLLVEQNADIVVLNEVDFRSFWSGGQNQAELIALQAGYPYVLLQNNVDVFIPFYQMRFGNAILSRYPILGSYFLDFPSGNIVSQIFVGGLKDGVAAKIRLPTGEDIAVVAIHLSLESEDDRVFSLTRVLDLDKRLGSLPMIVMGDFNSAPEGYRQHSKSEAGDNAIEYMERNGFSTVNYHETGARTFPAEHPTRLIDWVFVSSHWMIERYDIVKVQISDHFPVVAQLRLRAGVD